VFKYESSTLLAMTTTSQNLPIVVDMIGSKQGAAGGGIAGIEWLKRDRESPENPGGKLLGLADKGQNLPRK
jgi:hypothetical protein